MYELTKKEKKRAREIFSISIEKESEAALKNLEIIIAKWKNNTSTSREIFHETHTYLDNFLKHLQFRYDDLRPSSYLLSLGGVLKDGYIAEEELSDFSDESKEIIKRYSNFYKSLSLKIKNGILDLQG